MSEPESHSRTCKGRNRTKEKEKKDEDKRSPEVSPKKKKHKKIKTDRRTQTFFNHRKAQHAAIKPICRPKLIKPKKDGKKTKINI